MTDRAWLLARTKSIPQIEDLMAQVLSAIVEAVTVNLDVNQSGNPDGTSTSAILLTTLEQKEVFISDCRAAIERLESQSALSAPHVSFRSRRTEF
jgi:hypothetical protein